MDELKAYLRSDFFAHMIENFVLVARKLETLVALATQQPEHLTASPVGASIIAQCASRFLFPQRSLDVKAYVKAFGCTAAMIRQLSEEMPVLPMRTVLLQSEEESVVLQTELPDMDDEIAVLSSRAATAGLVDRLIEQHGDDPEAWAPHFFAQYRAVLRKEERDARRALRELEEKEEAA
jgi:type IV secretion system protein VirB4